MKQTEVTWFELVPTVIEQIETVKHRLKQTETRQTESDYESLRNWKNLIDLNRVERQNNRMTETDMTVWNKVRHDRLNYAKTDCDILNQIETN